MTTLTLIVTCYCFKQKEHNTICRLTVLFNSLSEYKLFSIQISSEPKQ